MERSNRLLLMKQRRFELTMLMVFGVNNSNHRRRRRRRLIRKLPRLREFEQTLFNTIVTEHLTIFNCPKCRMILTSPITLECGHTFCLNCLDSYREHIKCWICDAETIMTIINNNNNTSNNPCINVLVQDLVEKWRIQQQKTTITGNLMVNTINILRIQPRYHLRSGFAGLQINDLNNVSYNLLKTFNYDGLIDQKTVINAQDFECILCSRFLLDPVTTTCGHTFCRCCLMRVLDHGLSCPLCMATLTTKDYSRSTTFLLDQASKYLFIDEYKNRLNLHYKEIDMLNRNFELPVFVCTNAFPGVACPLYVYEPRYRLLIRRCLLSSTRRFAMAAKETTNSDEKFVCSGTILEIRDAVLLEDGSFILTTVGIRRFKVISKDEQDGYDTAKIQFIKDSPVSTEQLPDLLALHQKVYNKASKWILSLSAKVLAEVERLIGPMPKVERNWLNLPDGPAWTWWLMPILPLSSQLQLGFLNSTCLEKRLRAIDKMLDRMEIRMRALERNPMNCRSTDHSSDSCSDPERTCDIPFTTS